MFLEIYSMPVNVLVFAAGVGDRSLGWKKGVFCAMCVLYLGVYLHYFFNEKNKDLKGRQCGVWPRSSRIVRSAVLRSPRF